jgi:uncharacterized protein with HEPN domain
MTDKAIKYLSDIQQAICLIDDFLKDIERFSAYQSSLKTQSAVERQLGIIGEAVNKFRQEENVVVFNNAQQMVNFRNRIIHSYDNIDVSIVWAILKNHLPVLKKEVDDILMQI